MNRKRAFLMFALPCAIAGCDGIQMSPKEINADGNTYYACSGFIRAGSAEGGLFGSSTMFKVSFTDADGLDHVIWGIKNLSVNEMPQSVAVSMPSYLPDPKLGTDQNGNHYTEGVPYTWADGSKAILRNGAWRPVMVPNRTCEHQ